MDFFKQSMKGPTRPAPSVPGVGINRYSPVTNWNDDPFGTDVFEPTPQYQKKKPPPRPPPPKVNKQPDLPVKPSHFIRKPTVLSSILSRKTKSVTVQNSHVYQQNNVMELNSEVDPNKMFPKCEPRIVQTGALIDLSSPPSSPTFTTRSSSDGLSVDSFGSDATTSTTHQNAYNGGNASQAESGFEDDFDLFLSSKKISTREDTLDDFGAIDPFSSQPVSVKPIVPKKPVLSRDVFDASYSTQPVVPILKGPTIIRAKPARPKPPDSTAILKSTLGNTFSITSMNVNTTVPIHKVNNSFGDNFDSRPFQWDDESSTDRETSSERESSPPMPTIPPPPPPAVDDDLPTELPDRIITDVDSLPGYCEDDEPYAIALFDYFTDHPDDLCFSVNSKVKLIKRVDHEWLFGSLRSGAQGLFPANYVEIKVPLPDEHLPTPKRVATAIALYDFEPVQPGDLRLVTGNTITLLNKLNDEWYFGECNGVKGQFPVNYVQIS